MAQHPLLTLVLASVGKLVAERLQPRCHLLRLPTRVILAILELLPQYSQVFLSQTCTSFKQLVRDELGSSVSLIVSHDQRLEYLALRTSNSATHWVCESCAVLHPVTLRDTPSEPYHRLCPSKEKWLFERGFRVVDYHLAHRHVQLALKFSRLQTSLDNAEHRHHLERILAPAHRFGSAGSAYGIVFPTVVMQFWFTPLIVDGRFMFRQVSLLTPQDTSNLAPYFPFHACAHQGYAAQLYGRYLERREEAIQWMLGDVQGRGHEVKTAEDKLRDTLEPPRCGSLHMFHAVFRALQTPGEEVRLSCRNCRTDASLIVYCHNGHVEENKEVCDGGVCQVKLSSWHDLGGHSAPDSREWLAQSIPKGQFSQITAAPHDDPPGSIRDRFEEEWVRQQAAETKED